MVMQKTLLWVTLGRSIPNCLRFGAIEELVSGEPEKFIASSKWPLLSPYNRNTNQVIKKI